MKLVLKDNSRYILRFDKGEELFTALVKFCELEHIEAGTFTAIGATDGVILSFYDEHTKEYLDKKIEEELEIISLNGFVATLEGKIMTHAHGSFSDRHMNLRGGHMKELLVGSTCELVLTKLEGRIEREFSEDIGLNLLK